MIRFQLLQVTFKIIIKDFGSHLALKTSPFVEIIIYLLLERHEVLILTSRFQCHQILRYQLLCLNLMEEFLISNQISRCLLRIFELPELNH